MTPDELEVAFQRGELSQTCPCGLTEAAGGYCSKCLRPMGPADWIARTRQGAAGPNADGLRPGSPPDGSFRHSEAPEGATPPPAESAGHSIGAHQRCLRCGTEEISGSFCTWCRTAEYELIEHRHDGGSGCPLGPYLNPSTRPSSRNLQLLAVQLRAWEASPAAREAERYVTRRWTHPASGRPEKWPAMSGAMVAA
jgi:hypothetical protein